MKKELVIIYDTPAITHFQIMGSHNPEHYLQFFERIRILYWSKEKQPLIFEKESGRIIFYPYERSYDSRYISGLRFMFWIAKTLLELCQREEKTQLVLLTLVPLWAGLPTLLVGKLKKKKTILRLEAQKFEYLKEEAKLEGAVKSFLFFKLLILKLVYRLTIPFYDAVIGISDGVTKEAKKYGAKKTITLPIQINLEPFLAGGKEKSHFPVLVYAGQIKKIKGLEDLISSLRLLEKQGIKPKLLLAGEITNPKDEAFMKKIKNLSQGLEINFLGWLSHSALAEVHSKADIFVLPSYTEALGMAMMEAMASGLAIISTKTSGGQYLIEEGKTGFLVEKGKPEQLKEKIKILIENPVLRKSMGLAGKERIKKIMAEALQEEKIFWQELGISAKK
jgi:glycosyltransferase involved in cell wall biosynthesis